MSLYANILRAQYDGDDDIRKDGDTWTVCCWEMDTEEIPGIPSEEMARAIVRAIRCGFGKGVDLASYS